MLGNPIGIMVFIPKLFKLKPRGVPVGAWPLGGGKWPLLLASVRDGAM